MEENKIKRMAERKHPTKEDFFWCAYHKDYHHISKYSKNRAKKYGIMAICQEANKISHNRSVEKHGDYHKNATTKRFDRRHPTDPNLFWCGHHQRFEPRADFYAKDTKLGISSICKVAIAERKAQWYKDNIIKQTELGKDKLSAWCKRMMDNPHYFQGAFHKPATIENIKKQAKIYGM